MSQNRQGKQLTVWIPEEMMEALEAWATANYTTKTHAVVQAIQALTHPQPESLTQVLTQVEALAQRIEQVEQQLTDVQTRVLTQGSAPPQEIPRAQTR